MSQHISFALDFLTNPYSGLYIALEGIDGSGKSTQVKRLQEYFAGKNRSVTTTREPRMDLLAGELIFEVFSGKKHISPVAFQYLASANRIQNQEEVVIPSLKNGEVVLSDRCFWSAVPYGLMDQKIDFMKPAADLMLMANGILSHYQQFIVPDVVFYIATDPDIAITRIPGRKSNHQLYEKKEKIQTVARGYEWLVKQYPEMFVRIDGEKPVDEVTVEIVRQVERIM